MNKDGEIHMTPFLLLLMYSAIIIFIVSTSTLLYGPPHIRGVLRNDDVVPLSHCLSLPFGPVGPEQKIVEIHIWWKYFSSCV